LITGHKQAGRKAVTLSKEVAAHFEKLKFEAAESAERKAESSKRAQRAWENIYLEVVKCGGR
jgi:hypothetical protein